MTFNNGGLLSLLSLLVPPWNLTSSPCLWSCLISVSFNYPMIIQQKYLTWPGLFIYDLPIQHGRFPKQTVAVTYHRLDAVQFWRSIGPPFVTQAQSPASAWWQQPSPVHPQEGITERFGKFRAIEKHKEYLFIYMVKSFYHAKKAWNLCSRGGIQNGNVPAKKKRGFLVGSITGGWWSFIKPSTRRMRENWDHCSTIYSMGFYKGGILNTFQNHGFQVSIVSKIVWNCLKLSNFEWFGLPPFRKPPHSTY